MAASNKTTINRVTDDHFDKDKALEAALQQIQKQYGKGAIMKLGESGGLNIETISTGSVSLDIATGVSGIPRGRITEIYGPESSGKTTLALHIVAEAQRTGGRAAFIDAEHALDPEYAANLGVDVGELLVAQPDTGEQGLEICEMLVRSGAVDVVVVDSVAALVPKAEIQGEKMCIRDRTRGTSGFILHALLLSTTMQPCAAAIGANFSLVEPPAEKSAMSIGLSKEFSVSSSRTYSCPLNLTVFPADL